MTLPLQKIFSFLFIFLASSALLAHGRSESFSKWVISADKVKGKITLSALEDERIKKAGHETRLYIQRNILLHSKKDFCQFVVNETDAFEGFRNFEINTKCNIDSLTIRLFQDLTNNHIHMAKLIHNETKTDVIFNQAQTKINLKNEGGASNALASFIFGLVHILTGYDHLAFILALLFLLDKRSPLLFAISGFTLGHSLSLSLATLEILQPKTVVIESLIGFSIFLVASDAIKKNKQTKQWQMIIAISLVSCILLLKLFSALHSEFSFILISGLLIFTIAYEAIPNVKFMNYLVITTVFGLIHGFGFAGLLTDAQLSLENMVSTLLLFNLGVEVGQVTFVLTAIFIVRYIEKFELLKRTCLVLLLAIGLYWFVIRALA